MNLVSAILDSPAIWTLSQKILGCDTQKNILYRSVFAGPCTILDFGCANGNTCNAFRDFDYYGIDTNDRLIRNAQKKFAAHRNVHFICADVLERPFPDNFFDAVLFAGTGHHLDSDAFLKIMMALGNMVRLGGSVHFFDTIRTLGEDSLLLRLLLHMDQGKFHRTEDMYRAMLPTMSPLLCPVHMMTTRMQGTLMPQPKYFYAEMRRV